MVLGLARCDLEDRPDNEEALVVEGFLETDRPLPPIRLRRTTPLSAPDEGDAVSGSTVRVMLDGTPIPYEEQKAGRYLPSADSVVRAGASWKMTARWRDRTVDATGRVPPPLSLTEVCVEAPTDPVRAVQLDSLRRDSLDIPTTVNFIYALDVTVRWPSALSPAQADTSHWVRAQLQPDASAFPSEFVGFFLEPVTVQREDAFRETENGRTWTGVYALPVDSTDADLLATHDLTATLVRGDTAFASFAQTRTDPDRRAPISNVRRGLGIVTAVSVDSLTVQEITEPGTQECRQSS